VQRDNLIGVGFGVWGLGPGAWGLAKNESISALVSLYSYSIDSVADALFAIADC
jgi:hypothetical protein